MNTFAAIDLSLLPAPQIVEQIDYEQILAERKAYAISLWPVEEQPKIAARLEVGGVLQLLEHFQLAADMPLLTTQIALFTGGKLAAVRVLLGSNPFLLAAAQLLADAAGQLIACPRLKPFQQRRCPGLEGFQIICHRAQTIRWCCPGRQASSSGRGIPLHAVARLGA